MNSDKPCCCKGMRLLQGVGLSLAAGAMLLVIARAGAESPSPAPAEPAPPPESAPPAQPVPAGATAEAQPYIQSIPGTDVSFEMLPIPGGKFKMGSPESEEDRNDDDEGPQFEVEIEPFHMGKYEVTWAEYREFLNNYHRLSKVKERQQVPADQMADAVTYPTPLYELDAGPVLDRMGRTGKHPAVIMSQFGAKQYTKWLSKKTGRFYRLPTEAEWEYACRAGTATAYSFGDDPDKLGDHAWFIDNSDPDKDFEGAYSLGGQKLPNPWGLHDMHGNVAEWCLDGYDEEWYQQFEGKTVKWDAAINWPKTQYGRVIRGGGWDSEAQECRSAARLASDKDMNQRDPQLPRSPYYLTEGFWIGFRVISPAKEPSEAEKLKYWEADDPDTKRHIVRDRDIREVLPPATPAGTTPAATTTTDAPTTTTDAPPAVGAAAGK